jgi:hypothetical protein
MATTRLYPAERRWNVTKKVEYKWVSRVESAFFHERMEMTFYINTMMEGSGGVDKIQDKFTVPDGTGEELKRRLVETVIHYHRELTDRGVVR